jgi:transposase
VIGRSNPQSQLFGTRPLSDSVPEDHVLRKIRQAVDEILPPLLRALESSYCTTGGVHGVPPEILIRAKLLQALYSIKSERALCEQIEWNVAFRWFVGLDWDDTVFDHSTICVNRQRLFGDGAVDAILGETVRLAQARGLLNSDRLVVDGTQIKAWASMKSFKAKDGSEDDKPNFKGTRRSNQTHSSKTDLDARIYRKGKGQESMLCYLGHVAVDAATGIVRACCVTLATGKAEVEAAIDMARTCAGRGTKIVGDRGYDQQPFLKGIRGLQMVPHPRAKSKNSQLCKRIASSVAHEASMKKRYIVEGVFGWGKSVAGMRQTKLRGLENVKTDFTLQIVAKNLLTIVKRGELQPNCA